MDPLPAKKELDPKNLDEKAKEVEDFVMKHVPELKEGWNLIRVYTQRTNGIKYCFTYQD